MQRLALMGTILLTLIYVPCLGKPPVGEAANEVPFSFEKGYVIVKAKIKRNVEVEVIISTGAEYSVADEGLLDKYKISRLSSGGPPIFLSDIYGPLKVFTSVPDVSIGEAKTTSLTMGVSSTLAVSKVLGREIFGSLGANFFKDRVVQVDFKKRVLRFIDQSSSELSFDKKEGAISGGRIMLRMIENEEPLRVHLIRPIVENVTFNGKIAKLLLDTGTVTVIALSSSAAKKLGCIVPSEKGSPRSDRVESLRLGAYELKNVPVVIYAKGTSVDQSLGEYGAVAGSLFLQNFIVTLNFRTKVVVLEHL
jgi:hypothetical protein